MRTGTEQRQPTKRRLPATAPGAEELAGWGEVLRVAALVALFFAVAAYEREPAMFGFFHDDTLYFSSARALADGQGYIMPSLPGAPAQTKYPILYPLLLAGVWKLDPVFPGNISTAMWLTTVFGCALAAGWYWLLRDLGAGRWTAWALAALSSLQPLLLSMANAVLSDVPFMAFAVWAVVLAGRALQNGNNPDTPGFREAGQARRRLWVAAAVCAAGAALTRSIGMAVIAGIVAWALYRRAYRGAALFAAITVPSLGADLLWTAMRQTAVYGLPGYRQTMLFYTNYLGFWRLSVGHAGTLARMLEANLKELALAPAVLCFPLQSFTTNGAVQQAIMGMISLVLFAGLVVSGRKEGWHPAHFVLIFYSLIVLGWNYRLANRFLLLFLPLFFRGAVIAGQALAAYLRAAFRDAVSLGHQAASGGLALAAAILIAGAAHSYFWVLPREMSQNAEVRGSLASEKSEAYQWAAGRSEPGDRFICYEDASFFLETGRQAMRPLAFSSAVYYDPPARVIESDFNHIGDVAREIRARYWVESADDFGLEAGGKELQQRTRRFLQRSLVVFESSRKRVRIHVLAPP